MEVSRRWAVTPRGMPTSAKVTQAREKLYRLLSSVRDLEKSLASIFRPVTLSLRLRTSSQSEPVDFMLALTLTVSCLSRDMGNRMAVFAALRNSTLSTTLSGV